MEVVVSGQNGCHEGSGKEAAWALGFTLLDGLALETVEHLTLEQLTSDTGDETIWSLLEERFPDKLKHDHLAECLREVFSLQAKDGETVAEWTSRVQETFSKCRRKVSVEFPPEARGWITLNNAGLSPDQRAIVVAKTGGDLKFETVVTSMRSCFPDYVASGKTKKATTAYLADPPSLHGDDDSTALDAHDAVAFDEVEAFLADYGVSHDENQGEFDEAESAEILAATWRDKRNEIARLQKSRNFKQVTKVQQQFKEDLNEVKKRTRCRKCNKLGHWARECPQQGKSKGKGSMSSADRSIASGAAMVEQSSVNETLVASEVLLVSSPGYGIIDSGCGKTLIGQTTLNELYRLYHERGIPLPSLRRQSNLFAFGNNKEETSQYVVDLKVGIAGRWDASRPHNSSSNYGPIRFRHTSKKPEIVFRPPETLQSDFSEAVAELSHEKRAISRSSSCEPPTKASKTEALTALVKTVETVEVFLANFLKKKMQTELHHSKNPPEIQEAIDESKIVEWLTLQDEKQVIKVIEPQQAANIRKTKPDRIMSSRFVITKKVEDGDTRMKSRWCLRGHHDPDLLEKVASGKCHSPTLAQMSKNILLQILVSHQWTMNLGDIKGAFLEANVKDQLRAKPVFAELPPGGVPGVPAGSLVQILGNIYGSNDAPHNWYVEFDTVAQQCGFTKSKFDSCLYWCFGKDGKLEGVLGAHVDDTITGGQGETYDRAIHDLRQRFPFKMAFRNWGISWSGVHARSSLKGDYI
eukprot:s2602_g8.t1